MKNLDRNQETLLSKGAIPRIIQEVFYTCDPKGNVKINRALTLKEFDKKLGQLIQEDIK